MNKKLLKNNNNSTNAYASFVILTISLGLFFLYATAIQPTQIFTSANAATTNSTQEAKSTANQTGEKMQAGAANMTQKGKATANQTGEKMQAGATNATQEAKSGANQAGQTTQSIMNKTGETLQSFVNKTGDSVDSGTSIKVLNIRNSDACTIITRPKRICKELIDRYKHYIIVSKSMDEKYEI